MALNKNQVMFVREYITNGYNATKAYHAVFPKCTRDSASTNASRYMANPEIKEEIRKLQLERYEALNINAERIAEELANMAFACKGDEDYTATVKLKALDLLQKQFGLQKQNISAQVETTTITVKVEEEDEKETC